MGAAEVLVPHRADVCEAGFTYWPDAKQARRGLLQLAAKDLGLNAQGALYRVAFDRGSVQYLGELPVAAEPDGPDRFRLVQQEGGSVHLQRYRVGASDVRPEPVALELVMDGTVCTDRAEGVFVLGIGSGVCDRPKSASPAAPVCLVHAGTTTKMATIQRCRLLLNGPR